MTDAVAHLQFHADTMANPERKQRAMAQLRAALNTRRMAGPLAADIEPPEPGEDGWWTLPGKTPEQLYDALDEVADGWRTAGLYSVPQASS